MKTVIYWFRNDLRLHDHPGLDAALRSGAERLQCVYCLPDLYAQSRWGTARMGPLRQSWLLATLEDLQQQLLALGHRLLICHGEPATILPRLADASTAATKTVPIYCEDIAAPEEAQQVADLRARGVEVHTSWHSSLLDPASLPWSDSQLPASFTAFRQAVERAHIVPPAVLPVTHALASIAAAQELGEYAVRSGLGSLELAATPLALAAVSAPSPDARSSLQGYPAGERGALRQLDAYFASALPAHYKRSRNELSGHAFSSKWSIWLASGALSARHIYARLKQYEAQRGANDGSYWLWFELLWRDYFRLLHRQHGTRLYRAGGLTQRPVPSHDGAKFARWCMGQTGAPLVDAAMHELRLSAYLSNRLRQVVASYWLNELQGDWRAGAAWFETCLIDYDVYSNQANWLYIAGRGSDPRGGRHFNIEKQTAEHDADARYRRLWGVVN